MAHRVPPSALTHLPLSCLSAGTEPKYQGVVTYTLPVKAFATGIKRSTLFFGADQGIKMNSE